MSPVLVQDLKLKYDERKKVLEKTLVLMEKMKALYKLLYGDCVALWEYQLHASNHSIANENIKIKVEPEFKLYTKFQEWNKGWRTNGTDPTFLFCEINNENAGKFLNPWHVQFEGRYIAYQVMLQCVVLNDFEFTSIAMQGQLQ
jgi:hypothetical protein